MDLLDLPSIIADHHPLLSRIHRAAAPPPAEEPPWTWLVGWVRTPEELVEMCHDVAEGLAVLLTGWRLAVYVDGPLSRPPRLTSLPRSAQLPLPVAPGALLLAGYRAYRRLVGHSPRYRPDRGKYGPWTVVYANVGPDELRPVCASLSLGAWLTPVRQSQAHELRVSVELASLDVSL